MARRKDKVDGSSVLFDVYYEDGSRASNRRVPGASVGGLDGDEPAMAFIIDQDRRIADLSGKAPRVIKKLVRSA